MECCTDQEWKGNWDPFVRLCFQFGMLLGVDEFQQDLGFHLCKHRLGQRLFNGWGLVWGVGIVDPIDFDPDPAQKKAKLTVGPLFALDELGRELWVKEPCTIDLFQWALENSVPDDTPIYVTIAYRSCCVAPVPAVAAPCNDSASATMPSRVIESVECTLSLDPPDAPIDLSDLAPSASDTLPIRFQTLVDLIRNDASRPLLLGSVSRTTAAGGNQSWAVTPAAGLARITGFGGEALRVVESAIVGTNLEVTFSRTPTYAVAAAFQVYQLAGTTLTPLVTGASTVTPDATDPRKLIVTLAPGAPTSGYRIEVAGTGPSAVLFMTPTGPAPLNEGRNYTRWGMP